MKVKKDRGRFTVRFDMENQDHVRAVEYLERQRDRGKAQYLADAILCYEKAETNSFPQADRALIEQIVQEYLEKQRPERTPDLQKEEPSISSPPIDLIASALADFRGESTIQKKGFRQQMRKPFLRRRIVNISFSFRRESYRWPPRPSCGRGYVF